MPLCVTLVVMPVSEAPRKNDWDSTVIAGCANDDVCNDHERKRGRKGEDIHIKHTHTHMRTYYEIPAMRRKRRGTGIKDTLSIGYAHKHHV